MEEVAFLKESQPEVYQAKLNALAMDTDATIMQILTAEQSDLYRTYMGEERGCVQAEKSDGSPPKAIIKGTIFWNEDCIFGHKGGLIKKLTCTIWQNENLSLFCYPKSPT